MANAVEQALLLPTNMDDLRSMRKHKVFLSLKRDLAMVSPLAPFFPLYIFFFFFFLQLYFLP